MENVTTTTDKSIAVKWGIIISLISCVVSTIANMYLTDNLMVYGAVTIINIVVSLILLGLAAAQQRKAQGGYITFKEAFRVIFIAILIIVAVTYVYGIIYAYLIDPECTTRLKETYLRVIEKSGMPQEKLDAAAAKADEQFKSIKDYSIGGHLMALLRIIILYSIFGFIVAAIVKKKRPLEIQEVQQPQS